MAPLSLEAEMIAAARIADHHREVAADLPPSSELRALSLRCAERWDRIGRRRPQGLSLLPAIESGSRG